MPANFGPSCVNIQSGPTQHSNSQPELKINEGPKLGIVAFAQALKIDIFTIESAWKNEQCTRPGREASCPHKEFRQDLKLMVSTFINIPTPFQTWTLNVHELLYTSNSEIHYLKYFWVFRTDSEFKVTSQMRISESLSHHSGHCPPYNFFRRISHWQIINNSQHIEECYQRKSGRIDQRGN